MSLSYREMPRATHSPFILHFDEVALVEMSAHGDDAHGEETRMFLAERLDTARVHDDASRGVLTKKASVDGCSGFSL